jgi:hypothetical protein
LFEDFRACRVERLPLAHHRCHVLGKIVWKVAGLFIGILACSEWRVNGRSGTPDLVGFADVITRVAKQVREARDRTVPLRGLQDGAASCVEK